MDITPYLRHINSMTKYPPIPTYHHLDPKTGMLTDDHVDFGDAHVSVTEKLDGTNARIVVFPDGDWIIGSRETLLTSRGDRVADAELGIVDAVSGIVASWDDNLFNSLAHPTVFYGEVYGGGIGAGWKNYTNSKQITGFRVFDAAYLVDFEPMLGWPVEKIASWRQHVGPPWVDQGALWALAAGFGLHLVPRLRPVAERGSDWPDDLEGMADALHSMLPCTHASLDGGAGRAEGVVMRTAGRRVIAKARLDDYRRTLRRRADGEGHGG